MKKAKLLCRDYFSYNHRAAGQSEGKGVVRRRRRRPAEILHDWALDSSCNGVPNIERSRYLRKLAWLLIVLAGTVLTIYMLGAAVKRYLDFEVKVVVFEEFESNISLPAITICNLNAIRKDKFHLLGVADPSPAYLHSRNPNLSAAERADALLIRENLTRTMMIEWFKLNDSAKHDIGHKIEDMLVACKMGYVPCSAKDFKRIPSKDFGNCYVFNRADDGSAIYHMFQAGIETGLTLVLNVQHDQYMMKNEDVGFVLVIHDQKSLPFPEQVGIALPPGFSTRVSFQKKRIIKMPHPYTSNCWEVRGEKAHRVDVFSERFNTGYSTEGCQLTCVQKNVIKNCSCANGYIPSHGLAFEGGEAEICATHDQIDCAYRVLNLTFGGMIKCDCPVQCTVIDYDTSVSQALWPNWDIEEHYNTEFGFDTRRNLVKVQLYYQLLNIATIKEEPDYPIEDLYSDLGGNVGLFLGFSVVGLFEVLELCIDLVLSCYHGRTRKTSQPTTRTTKPNQHVQQIGVRPWLQNETNF